ncbi:hypothetical protein XELAEV_18015633mg [Xenopus laevis]|uniref:Uncharacterized protein n=1 Tax=Xenopus laevis TaxID=8355 RepID=A0A974DK83_XENLA|nr:hypothetical protein XELAEV_18015633mg [Xenopus laevis]
MFVMLAQHIQPIKEDVFWSSQFNNNNIIVVNTVLLYMLYSLFFKHKCRRVHFHHTVMHTVVFPLSVLSV